MRSRGRFLTLHFADTAGQKQTDVEDSQGVVGREKDISLYDVFSGEPDMLP